MNEYLEHCYLDWKFVLRGNLKEELMLLLKEHGQCKEDILKIVDRRTGMELDINSALANMDQDYYFATSPDEYYGGSSPSSIKDDVENPETYVGTEYDDSLPIANSDLLIRVNHGFIDFKVRNNLDYDGGHNVMKLRMNDLCLV